MAHWWMSFADPARPKGEQWLGCAIVEGHTPNDVLSASHARGINPGGEIQMAPMPPVAVLATPTHMIGRLLSRDEVERLDMIILLAVQRSGAASS